MQEIWEKWTVRGIVQGVGFRHFVRRVARAIGVKGFVRNEDDGSVTIVAGGTFEQLGELRRRVLEGNGWSHVSSITTEPLERQDYVDFVVEF